MALTATYDAALARVQLVADTFDADTARAVVTRFDTTVLTNGETVRGGQVDPLATGDTVRLDDYEFTPGVVNTYQLITYDASDNVLDTFTDTITPNLTGTWLKSVVRPFLNRSVTVVDFSAVQAPARGGVFEVIGRRLPVAITEVRGSRRYSLTIVTATAAEAEAVELFLSFGDIVYVQPPAGCSLPGPLYAYVGDVSVARKSQRGDRRYFTLPLVECAAPDALIVGSTVTWAGVVSGFATWADVVAAFTTWEDVVTYISDPSDEVVG